MAAHKLVQSMAKSSYSFRRVGLTQYKPCRVFDNAQTFACAIYVSVEHTPHTGKLPHPNPLPKGEGDDSAGEAAFHRLLPYAFKIFRIMALVERPATRGMRTTFLTNSRPTISPDA